MQVLGGVQHIQLAQRGLLERPERPTRAPPNRATVFLQRKHRIAKPYIVRITYYDYSYTAFAGTKMPASNARWVGPGPARMMQGSRRPAERKARQGRGRRVRQKIKRARETSAARAPFDVQAGAATSFSWRRFSWPVSWRPFLLFSSPFRWLLAQVVSPNRPGPRHASGCARDSIRKPLCAIAKSTARTGARRGRRNGIDKARKIFRVFEKSYAEKMRGFPAHSTRAKIAARDSRHVLTRGQKFFRDRGEKKFFQSR